MSPTDLSIYAGLAEVGEIIAGPTKSKSKLFAKASTALLPKSINHSDEILTGQMIS
jgi:hypothetical protein